MSSLSLFPVGVSLILGALVGVFEPTTLMVKVSRPCLLGSCPLSRQSLRQTSPGSPGPERSGNLPQSWVEQLKLNPTFFYVFIFYLFTYFGYQSCVYLLWRWSQAERSRTIGSLWGMPGCGKGRPGWTGAHSPDCPVQSCWWPMVTLGKSVSFPTLEPAALMDAAGGCFRGPAAVVTEFLVPPPIPLIQEACRKRVILCWWGN